MEYDELVIHGYRQSSGFYQINVSHDQLVPEGGAVSGQPISFQQVAETRAKYDDTLKNVRQHMQGREPYAASQDQRLWQIACQLQSYPLALTEQALAEMRLLCESFLAQWHRAASTPGVPFDYRRMLVIGRAMRNMFPGTSLDLLRRSLHHVRAATPRRGLRVIVEVEEHAVALLDLPWEMLTINWERAVIEDDTTSPSANFLCFHQDVVLMRQIRNIGVSRPIQLARPLSSQVFVAQPVQGAPIDARLFADELQPLHPDQPLDAWWSTDPDMLHAMRKQLARYNPQIVQLVCHGRRSPGRHGVRSDMLLTYVEDGQTHIHRVSPHDLLQVLQGAPQLQIVLLTVCDSARTDHAALSAKPPSAADEQPAGSASNIAYDLIRGGVPLVIAMQEKITQTAAAHFSRVLYEQIQQGEPIERALTEARRSLLPSRWGMDWTMPVVYRGSTVQQPVAWPTRLVNRLETAVLAPRQGRAIRATLTAVFGLLVVGGIARLIWPSQLSFDARTLLRANLIWGGSGLLMPLLVTVLLRPERLQASPARMDNIAYSERAMIWCAHLGGSMLGYTIGGLTLALAAPVLYLIGEWVPALLWQLVLALIIGGSLLLGVVMARAQARGARANFQLYPDTYGPSTWGIIAAGMIIINILIPAFLIPLIIEPLATSVGPGGVGIATAVTLWILQRAVSRS